METDSQIQKKNKPVVTRGEVVGTGVKQVKAVKRYKLLGIK